MLYNYLHLIPVFGFKLFYVQQPNVGGPLKLRSLAGLFYLLIGCLFLGLIILIFERMFKSPIEARIGKARFLSTLYFSTDINVCIYVIPYYIKYVIWIHV